jgi:iron(III) transport system ATP-binding protein
VAGFIGRTNFVPATSDGASIAFDGFSMPIGMFDASVEGAKGDLTFSVRPQSMSLSRDSGQSGAVEARIVQRAYLGDVWDYVVQPANGGLNLRVAAPPVLAFDVGDRVWLGLDPAQMALIR